MEIVVISAASTVVCFGVAAVVGNCICKKVGDLLNDLLC